MSPAYQTPGSTAIRMIAYAEHDEACTFLTEMTGHIWPLLREVSWPVVLTTTIVTTKEQMLTELQADSALTLVSAHGPARDDAPDSPRIGDLTDKNRIYLRDLRPPGFAGFGTHAGMIWDACYAGHPAFREELARLSRPGVVHIGPLGEIEYDHSVQMATTILDVLLALGSPPITPEAVAAAAARAAGIAQIPLEHGPLGGTGSS